MAEGRRRRHQLLIDPANLPEAFVLEAILAERCACHRVRTLSQTKHGHKRGDSQKQQENCPSPPPTEATEAALLRTKHSSPMCSATHTGLPMNTFICAQSWSLLNSFFKEDRLRSFFQPFHRWNEKGRWICHQDCSCQGTCEQTGGIFRDFQKQLQPILKGSPILSLPWLHPLHLALTPAHRPVCIRA